MAIKRVTAKVGLPFGIGEISGEWEPDDRELAAAWEMYIELVTRVTVVPLESDEGLLEEALTSFYALFGITRDLLRRYGPEVARTDRSPISFGHLAVSILNGALRPFLAKWHPLLDDRAGRRPPDVSKSEWERSWDRHDELRSELDEVRQTLRAYAGLLGDVCGARGLLALADAPTHRPG